MLLLAVSAWFLYPTASWYFMTTPENKALASSSREQIRDYAQKQAKAKLEELKAPVRQGQRRCPPGPTSTSCFPAHAQLRDRQAGRAFEVDRSIGDAFKAYTTEEDFLYGIEEHYRKAVTTSRTRRARSSQLRSRPGAA